MEKQTDKFEEEFSVGGMDFNEIDLSSSVISVIGIGAGGIRAVNRINKQDMPDALFATVHEEEQTSSMDEKETESAIEKIEPVFHDPSTKVAILAVGMSGNTRYNVSPIVARKAKEQGLLTIAIATIPFCFEGEKKRKRAIEKAIALQKEVDALFVVYSDQLISETSDCDLDKAFSIVDEWLADAVVDTVGMFLPGNGSVVLSTEDIVRSLRNAKTMAVCRGCGDGEQRMEKALTHAFSLPFIEDDTVRTAKHIIFNIYHSQKAKLQVCEMKELQKFMAKSKNDADCSWGISVDNTLGTDIRVVVLVSGFNDALTGQDSEKRRSKLSLWMAKKVSDSADRIFGED